MSPEVKNIYEVSESFHLRTWRQTGPDICYLSSAAGSEELSWWRSRCALDSHRALGLHVHSGSSLCRTRTVRVSQPQPNNTQPLGQDLQSSLTVSREVLGLHSGDVSTPWWGTDSSIRVWPNLLLQGIRLLGWFYVGLQVYGSERESLRVFYLWPEMWNCSGSWVRSYDIRQMRISGLALFFLG